MPEKDLIQRFPVSEKMRLAAASWGLKGEDLGRFLRRNGISFPELDSWRNQMKDGMDAGKPLPRNAKKSLENKIATLEKQLKKAHGIIELQKKVQQILAEEKSIPEPQEKKSSRKSKKLF